ncbi:ComEA family DNA-binding protein [Simiduia curdlanivorans]|uniref:ComEA family DNA-binding protein n=1 Tax=Simiduia curdlanivorans TaxID=1492769 RepID=A0ABV8V6V5_9GAMM
MRIQRIPMFALIAFLSCFSALSSVTYAAADAKVVASQSALVNINTASAEELAQKLKGVGMSKAKAIVEYRSKVGKFITVDQLAEVKGIGAATVEKNRAAISLK